MTALEGRQLQPKGARSPGHALGLALALAACTLVAACGGGGGNEPAAAVSAEDKARLQSASSAFAGRGLDALRSDTAAVDLGHELFAAHCADCHGADGIGKRGVPDLTRGRFNYGTSADAIRTTITAGRHSEMPAMGREYGEVELGQLVSYIETFSAPPEGPLSDNEQRGRTFYGETCIACHGEDGRGQQALGAPDLTDDYWQHGDSMMNMRLVITRGVVSDCPPHGDSLTPPEVDLLTAWLLELIDAPASAMDASR